MESALGGNPTNDDAAAVKPAVSAMEDGGTNWFYQVHNRLSDIGIPYEVYSRAGVETPRGSFGMGYRIRITPDRS